MGAYGNESNFDFYMIKLLKDQRFIHIKDMTDTQTPMKNSSLLRKINGLCGSKMSSAFPGSMPIPMYKHHLNNLKKFKYTISEKLDGERHLLVFANNVIYFLNRKCEFAEIGKCNSDYNDTVIDGELMEDNTYMVFDAFCMNGSNTSRMKSHYDRLYKKKKGYYDIYHYTDYVNENTKFKASVKQFIDVQDYCRGTASFTGTSFPCDGYIFTPSYSSIHFGTDTRLLKWKDSETLTCDFKYTSENNLVVYDSISMNERVVGQLSSCENEVKEGDIIECKYDSNDSWKFIKFRRDKNKCNSFKTYKGTIRAIQENIQFNEVVESLRDHFENSRNKMNNE